MKHIGKRLFIILISSQLIASCSNNPVQTESVVTEPKVEASTPAKEILINNGRFDKPYTSLGQIEYTLKSPTPADQSELRSQAIDSLKKEAFLRYGEKVDAIIDTKVQESLESGENPVAVTSVQGTAVSFAPEKEKLEKRKSTRKVHHKKHKAKKTAWKKQSVKKVTTEQTKITPTEMLK
ncbi:MAG: hypothetical protein ABL933_03130 [Methyloglobulus sp.]|nr:hypothetical protein [Methyloglobulus sp.]